MAVPSYTKTVLLFLFVIYLCCVNAEKNKYSEEMNKPSNIHNLKDPLRMGKLNIIWEKARKHLSETKLQKLLSELKVQDTEELTFKKLKSSGGDKEGLKEAELRRKLTDILKHYGLEGNAAESGKRNDDLKKKFEKAIFKDKKLNKLWLKAEQSGLTQDELKTLKEEFQHHQDKIDEYYMLIEEAGSQNDVSPEQLSNDIHQYQNLDQLEGSYKDYAHHVNAIREKHRDLKHGYDDLHKRATSGPDSKEFGNPKVAGLWKLALRSDFNGEELESLYTELKHYEARLQKLTYLDKEIKKSSLGKFDDDDLSEEDKEKILKATDTEGQRILQERLEKQIRKANKMHEHLESRILARHSEL